MPATTRPELVVLGAGPAYTDKLGATGAAYLIRSGDEAVLLDLGQGSFPRLAAELEPSTLLAVVVSHLHADHFIDLVPLRHYLVWHLEPRRRVRVVAPAGIDERLDALHAEPGFSAAFDVDALEPGERRLGSLCLEAARVTHTNDSYGFRVVVPGSDAGVVYSGDCGRAEDLDALIRPGDDLIVEVSFGVGPVPNGAQHLDAAAVARLGARTRPRRILLTHIQMGFDPDETADAVRASFDGEVTVLHPGLRLEL
jgi:ribonuclease BN (tRNA processing enzyme)